MIAWDARGMGSVLTLPQHSVRAEGNAQTASADPACIPITNGSSRYHHKNLTAGMLDPWHTYPILDYRTLPITRWPPCPQNRAVSSADVAFSQTPCFWHPLCVKQPERRRALRRIRVVCVIVSHMAPRPRTPFPIWSRNHPHIRPCAGCSRAVKAVRCFLVTHLFPHVPCLCSSHPFTNSSSLSWSRTLNHALVLPVETAECGRVARRLTLWVQLAARQTFTLISESASLACVVVLPDISLHRK
jgi:hypothetical protein